MAGRDTKLSRVVVNGKFLRAQMTGVHRVAIELANALADLQREGHAAVVGLDLELWHSADGSDNLGEMKLPTKLRTPLDSIPWEQITLPIASCRRMVLSLCNIGPMLKSNAITMIHDVQVHLSPQSYSRPFRIWYRIVQPVIARRHRRILTVSQFSADEIVRAGLCPSERITVIHNGVDHILREAASTAAFERMKLSPQHYVVALSTTQKHKNIVRLLDAFAHSDLAALKLVLVGSTDRAAFDAIGITVPANVQFSGRVSDGDLRGLLEDALCLAFPSTTEGFGLPPLEAMLLGCPAVVAPCGALPEVCGNAALYAAPDKSGEWVSQISALAASPALRTEYVERGRAHAATFTWRKAGIKLARVLRAER